MIAGVCNAVTAPSELPFRDCHGDQGVPGFGESWTVWKTLKPKFESMQKASRWPPCSPLMPLNTAGSVLQPFPARRPGPLPDVQQVTISAAGEYLKPSVSVRGDAGYPDVARLSWSLDPACPVAVAVIIVHEQATCRRGEYLRMPGRI